MLTVLCDVDVSIYRFLPFSITRSHILTIWWKTMFKVGRLQLVCGSEWEIKRTQWAGIIIPNAAHIRTDHDMAGINDSEAGRWKEKLEDRQKRRPGVRGGGHKEWGKREGWGGKDELVEWERPSGSNASEFPSDRISGSFFFFGAFSTHFGRFALHAIIYEKCDKTEWEGVAWHYSSVNTRSDIYHATFLLPLLSCKACWSFV